MIVKEVSAMDSHIRLINYELPTTTRDVHNRMNGASENRAHQGASDLS